MNRRPCSKRSLRAPTVLLFDILDCSPSAALAADMGAARTTEGDKLLVDEQTAEGLKTKVGSAGHSGLARTEGLACTALRQCKMPVS